MDLVAQRTFSLTILWILRETEVELVGTLVCRVVATLSRDCWMFDPLVIDDWSDAFGTIGSEGSKSLVNSRSIVGLRN